MKRIQNEKDLVNKKQEHQKYLDFLLYRRNEINDQLGEVLFDDPRALPLRGELAKIKKEVSNTRRLMGHYKKMGPKMIKPTKDIISGRVLKTIKDDLVKRYGSPQKVIEALVELEQSLWR